MKIHNFNSVIVRRGALSVCLVAIALFFSVAVAAAQGNFSAVRAIAASSDAEQMRQEILDLQRAIVDLRKALDSVLTCADRGMLYSRASSGCIVPQK